MHSFAVRSSTSTTTSSAAVGYGNLCFRPGAPNRVVPAARRSGQTYLTKIEAVQRAHSDVGHVMQRTPIRAAAAGTLAASLMLGSLALPVQAYTPPPAQTESSRGQLDGSTTGASPRLELPDDSGASFVLDYGKVLSRDARYQINSELAELKEATGWKVTVVTSYGEGSAPPLKELKQYWNIDSKTIIVSVDEFKGNVLEFYYATQTLKEVIPKNVFQELRGRYGNVYFIREVGVESTVQEVTSILKGCLQKGGCNFIPGLSQQQREVSLVAVIAGAFLSGAVLRNELSRWTYIFLFIWVPYVFLFGFYPLYIRQPEDLTPIFENLGIFSVIFAFMYLTPLIGEVKLPSALAGIGKDDSSSYDKGSDGQGTRSATAKIPTADKDAGTTDVET